MPDFSLPSHVSKQWTISVETSTGEALSPADFEFFGAATAPGAWAVAMRSTQGEGSTVLTLPPLCQAGTWHYSVFCRQRLTGVTWQVDAGMITVTPSPCLAQPSLDPDPVLLTAMLDPETLQVTVTLGDSVAATAAAAQQATQAAAAAQDSQIAAAQSAAAAQTSQTAAAQSAADAQGSKTAAAQSAADAQGSKTDAAQSAVDAQTAQSAAEQSAADAQTSQSAAAQSAANAQAAQSAAEQSAADAQAAQTATAQSAADAQAAQSAAEQSAADAQAAQSEAEEQAALAADHATAAATLEWSRGFALVSFKVGDPVAEIWSKLAAVSDCEAVAIDVEGSFESSKIAYFLTGAPTCEAETLALRNASGGFRAGGGFCSKVFPNLQVLYVYQEHLNSLWSPISVKLLYVQLLSSTATNWSTYLSSGRYQRLIVNAKTIETSVYSPMYNMSGNQVRVFNVSEQADVSYFFKSKDTQLVAGSVPAAIWANVEVATDTFYNSYALAEVYLPAALPKLRTADGMYHNCHLSKTYILQLLPTLPSWENDGSHLLTLGISGEYQHDAEVAAAIAGAEAKGWTLTVQWAETTAAASTVSTFGLRKPPIYARVEEHEVEDGEVHRTLRWGHYVTDPSGYMEFASVADARDHFGLPEADGNI